MFTTEDAVLDGSGRNGLPNKEKLSGLEICEKKSK
jgi:hypothetical protein